MDDPIRAGNAIIRRYYGKDPDALSDDEWAKLVQEWNFTEKLERDRDEAQATRIRNILVELANVLYGKRK